MANSNPKWLRLESLNANGHRLSLIVKNEQAQQPDFVVSHPKILFSLLSYQDSACKGTPYSISDQSFVRPDLSTYKVLPWQKSHGIALSDFYKNGLPFEGCPRAVLRRALDNARKLGYEFKAGFESEFMLFNQDFTPVESTNYKSSNGLTKFSALLEEIADAIDDLGCDVIGIHKECGDGQFEIITNYTDLFKAVDNLQYTRIAITAIAQKHGLIASFLPKVSEEQAGNGAHCHISIWKDGKNITGDLSQNTKISIETQSFLQGILDNLNGILLFTTPHHNSFRRIKPQNFAGIYTCWGYGNKEAPIRVVLNEKDTQPITHFEIKSVDATSNTYFALAALITSGIEGIKQKAKLVESCNVDPFTLTEEERTQKKIKIFPSNFTQAFEAYEQTPSKQALQEVFGKHTLESYFSMRRDDYNYWASVNDVNQEFKALSAKY